MNKSEQTGPHRSLEIILVLLLQVKFCFYSQEQPFPNEQIDPSTSALVCPWCFLDFSYFQQASMLPAMSRLQEPPLAFPHRELLLYFAVYLQTQTPFLNQGWLTCRPVPLSWPIGVSGMGRLRRPEEEQEWLPAGGGVVRRAPQPQGAWGSFEKQSSNTQ